MSGPFSQMIPQKLLCDEMLKGLARWLRTAGYDVVTEPDGCEDRQLVQRALAESRILLTRDRFLINLRHAGNVTILVESNGLEACAREITYKLGVDWLLNPFTRCSLCNTVLVEEADARHVPPDITQVYRCPHCSKYYWQGGHVKRMRHKLECWQREFGREALTPPE